MQIEFDDSQILHATKQALAPEETSTPTDRVISHMECTDTTILLQFEALDLVGLRAAVNSYMRWIIGIQSVLETITE